MHKYVRRDAMVCRGFWFGSSLLPWRTQQGERLLWLLHLLSQAHQVKAQGKAKFGAARDFYVPPVWTAWVRVWGHTLALGLPPQALWGHPVGQASVLAPQVVPGTQVHSFLLPASPVPVEQPPRTSNQHFFPSLHHGMAVASGASAVVREVCVNRYSPFLLLCHLAWTRDILQQRTLLLPA